MLGTYIHIAATVALHNCVSLTYMLWLTDIGVWRHFYGKCLLLMVHVRQEVASINLYVQQPQSVLADSCPLPLLMVRVFLPYISNTV